MALILYWIIPYSVHRRLYAVNLNLEHFEASFNRLARCKSTTSTNMVLEVFSKHLDTKRHWFVLDSSVCESQPLKFYQNELFKLFQDEVKSLHMNELCDQNGDQIPKPRGRSDGKVYVGSTFAVIAGHLRRKCPSESNLLKSAWFEAIKNMMNGQSLASDVSAYVSTPTLNSSTSSSSSYSSGFSSLSSSRESGVQEIEEDDDRESLPRKRKHKILAPKELAPLFTSSPANESFRDIEEGKCQTPYKRRKIREKATSILSEIHEICTANREDLSTVIARCCLIERRDDFPTQKLIHDVFIEVENKLGVSKTFEKLVPDHLWTKKLKEMTVPDWQQLLFKLEVPISDDSWQTLLNRTHLGKGGVS